MPVRRKSEIRRDHDDAAKIEKQLLSGDKRVAALNQQARALLKLNGVIHAEMRMSNLEALEQRKWYETLAKCGDNKREMFKRARQFSEINDFIRLVLAIKKLVFMDGMQIKVTGRKGADERAMRRTMADIWTEWLINDNAIAAWVATEGEAPFVTVLNCEDVEYSDAFGVEHLKVWPKKETLTPQQRKELGDRYAKAITGRVPLVWGEDEREVFEVLTAASLHPAGKAGTGLGKPSMFSIFEALAIYGLLSTGDWNAAWTAKDVIRQIKKGHSIDSGNLAGMPMHFLKKAERDVIHKEMKNKSGAFDVVTNFDIEFEYPSFDFKYFSVEKWEGIIGRLVRWAGPVGMLLVSEGKEEREDILKLVEQEAIAHRDVIAGFFGQIATAGGFGKPGMSVEVTFSETTFISWTTLINLVDRMTGNGIMSPQTAREYLRLDVKRESARIRDAKKNRDDFTPVFEANQGILTNNQNPDPGTGGRPVE